MNSVLQISPYWYNGAWVFDDIRVGLDHEPFVLGASEVISRAVKEQKLKGAKKGFNLFFSSNPLPNAHVSLIRDKEWSMTGGTWYTSEMGERLWLCPSLFLYFQSAPKKMWAIVKPK